MQDNITIEGTVKWFSADKGYGFIHTPNKGDYYFHISSVIGANLPTQGDLVKFTPIKGKSDKPAATVVTILVRASLSTKHQYFGKPKYRTEVVSPAQPAISKTGTAAVLGGLGLIFGPVGGIVGAALGAYIGVDKDAVAEVTRQVEITSPCIRCGGNGQVTAEVGDRTGFQCPRCGSFWKVRTATLPGQA